VFWRRCRSPRRGTASHRSERTVMPCVRMLGATPPAPTKRLVGSVSGCSCPTLICLAGTTHSRRSEARLGLHRPWSQVFRSPRQTNAEARNTGRDGQYTFAGAKRGEQPAQSQE